MWKRGKSIDAGEVTGKLRRKWDRKKTSVNLRKKKVRGKREVEKV